MKATKLIEWGRKTLFKFKKPEHIAFLAFKYLDEQGKLLINNENVAKAIESRYKLAINKYTKENVPIANFFKYLYFYNLKLQIDQNCFTPRFETEQLVDELIDYLNQNNIYPKKILDACTGIGPIALSLKNNYSKASVDAFDINEKAIEMAKKSAVNLNLNVNFFVEDIEKAKFDQNWDVIIMNPPYIKDEKHVDQEVLSTDPHNALFAKHDGFYFYELFLQKIKSKKQFTNLIFAFEMGFDMKEGMEKLLKSNLKNIKYQIIKDYQNLDRIVIGHYVNK